jgi:membrane protease YdiL (CAAX protease family)
METKTNESKQIKNETLMRNIIAFVTYFIGMVFIAGIISLILRYIPGNTIKTSPEELVISGVATDSDGIAFIKKDSYNDYSHNYDKYLTTIDYDNEYLVIVNNHNDKVFKKDWVIIDDENNESINVNTINEFISGTKTKWDKKRSIKLYITSEEYEARPLFVTDYSILNTVEFKESTDNLSFNAMCILQFVLSVILFISLGFILWPSINYDLLPFKKKEKHTISSIFIGLGFVMAANILANLTGKLLSIIFNIPGGVSLNQIHIELAFKSKLSILMILAVVIFTPIVEELVFRKAIFGLFKNKWVGFAVSTLIFGLIHVTGEIFNSSEVGHFLYVLTPYLFMGVGFGLAYIVFKKNVITTIGTHILLNLLATLITFIG